MEFERQSPTPTVIFKGIDMAEPDLVPSLTADEVRRSFFDQAEYELGGRTSQRR